jgi:hypothetical protein
MKILVGLVSCIENELEECVKSIKNQTHKAWELFTIENKTKKEAHDKLYSTFMERAGEFDLFIKVDADMVLARPTLFQEIVDEMKQKPAFDHFQIGVWDFFTDRLIFAFHVYRSTVKWNIRNEQYFTDSIHQKTNCAIYMDLNGPLAPAAWHSPNPSPFQAFHFGIHKAIKVIQAERAQKRFDMSKSHLKNIMLLWKNYQKKKDERLGYALHGVFWALNTRVNHEVANYSNKKAKNIFQQLEKMDSMTRRRSLLSNYYKFRLWMPFHLWHFYMFDKYTRNRNEAMSISLAFARGAKNFLERK